MFNFASHVCITMRALYAPRVRSQWYRMMIYKYMSFTISCSDAYQKNYTIIILVVHVLVHERVCISCDIQYAVFSTA